MSVSKPGVSVVISHYNGHKLLLACLRSLKKFTKRISYEVIVNDNDIEHPVKKELLNEFPLVKYVTKDRDLGFGGGHNHAESYATGEYIFLLNVDTLFKNNVIEALVTFHKKHKNAGIIAPLLLQESGEPYPLQGSATLTPLRGIFVLGIFNRLFPKLPIIKNYWQAGWDKTKVRKIDIVPGTAMLMKRSLFETVGRFDEKMFIYFEDHDLGKRVRDAGYENFIIPQAKLFHAWGATTTNKNVFNKYFAESRFYYFKKHYGVFAAALVSFVSQIGKYDLFFGLTFLLAAFLLLFRLSELMMFIGDFGWFYLSARDMIVTGQIPLVGIASSHPWLHQGPLWTYLLAIGFAASHFHPVSGGIIAVLFGLGSVFLMYKAGKELFNPKVGLFAALLFATSPLIIIHARMPYHTTPIPFFTTLLFYSLYRWIKGSPYYFCIALLSVSVLYNLELASIVYMGVVAVVIGWGIVKKQLWIKKIKKPRILFFSGIAFFLPLIPILFYDTQHGFPQTLKFAAWMGYKVLTVFGYPPLHEASEMTSYSSLMTFFTEHMQKLFFLPSMFIAVALLLLGTGFVFFTAVRSFSEKKLSVALSLLVLFLSAGFGGFFAAKTSSEAYLPMLFPAAMLSVALFFTALWSFARLRSLVFLTVFFIIIMNILSLLQQHYLMAVPKGGYGPTFSQRMYVADVIVKDAGENRYTIKGRGPGSQFENYTMNYEYLTWWKGHGPFEWGKSQYIITDSPMSVTLHKE